MFQFEPITTLNKEEITQYTYPFAPRDCEFCFPNLYCWHFAHKSKYAIIYDTLVIELQNYDGQFVYTLPIGTGDKKKAILYLCEHIKDEPLRIQGELRELETTLEGIIPGKFEYVPHRGFFDYIYLRSNLVNLRGSALQSKRNHVNRFHREYQYEYIEMTADMITDCLRFAEEWQLEHITGDSVAYSDEHIAMVYALNNFDALGLKGGAIIINGQMEAFAYGAPINNDTFDVMVEKANVKYEGIYSVINQEFSSHISEQYMYLNREEDLDVPGLRKAKLSYHPNILLEKAVATLK